jgi:hypothetical protein
MQELELPGRQCPGFDGGANRAAWFGAMAAIAEAATLLERPDLENAIAASIVRVLTARQTPHDLTGWRFDQEPAAVCGDDLAGDPGICPVKQPA